MKRWRPYYRLDLSQTGLLPTGWQAEVDHVVSQSGIDTILTGEGSTSREASRDLRINVRVADGCVVQARLPWLWALYHGPLKDYSSECFQRPLFAANLVHTAVNINKLVGRGAQYEWHVDSNPVTGVLFVTSSDNGLGGSLIFKDGSGKRSLARARAGTFICFDARDIPHRVAPLRRDGARVSVPMNFYHSSLHQPRPDDLDIQIYSTAQTNRANA